MNSRIARSFAATAVALAMFASMSAAASAKKPPNPATVSFDLAFTVRTLNETPSNQRVDLPIVLSKKAPRGGLTITYTIGAGTATAGADFTPAGGQVVVPGGKKKATLSFNLLRDNILEDSETFTVRLTGASSGAIGATSALHYTIVDDDAPTGEFRVTECVATEFPARGYVTWAPLAGATSYRVEMYREGTLIGWAETGPSPTTTFFPLSTSQIYPPVHVTVIARTDSGTQTAERHCLSIID